MPSPAVHRHFVRAFDGTIRCPCGAYLRPPSPFEYLDDGDAAMALRGNIQTFFSTHKIHVDDPATEIIDEMDRAADMQRTWVDGSGLRWHVKVHPAHPPHRMDTVLEVHNDGGHSITHDVTSAKLLRDHLVDVLKEVDALLPPDRYNLPPGKPPDTTPRT